MDIYVGEKDRWGQGYATDALRTMCRYGFDTMRLHKISLTVVTENHAAHHNHRKLRQMWKLYASLREGVVDLPAACQ